MAAPVVWFEVYAQDAERAMRFYRELFGWNFTPHKSEADDRDMWTIDTGQVTIGGTLVINPDATPIAPEPAQSGSLLYVQVNDIDACIEHASTLGAEVVRPARHIGGEAGTRAQIRDLDGHLIGIWTP